MSYKSKYKWNGVSSTPVIRDFCDNFYSSGADWTYRTFAKPVKDFVIDRFTYDGTEDDYYEDAIYCGLIPGLSQLRSVLADKQNMEHYMESFGYSWSDIKHPEYTRLYSSVSNATRSGFEFVSSNVGRLYR